MTHNSRATDKPVALEFPIELELRNVDLYVMSLAVLSRN